MSNNQKISNNQNLEKRIGDLEQRMDEGGEIIIQKIQINQTF